MFLRDAVGPSPSLAGRFNHADLVTVDHPERINRSDLRQGLRFQNTSGTYEVISRNGDLIIVDGNGNYSGRIIPSNSYKGFNVEVEALGHKTTVFIYFLSIKRI